MEDKAVSVIIPVYNAEKTIQSCVRSVLMQENSALQEILIIDDGSADKTVLRCREFEKENEKVKVVQNPHAGVSSARNCGIKKAKGRWLLFLDADDKLEKGALYSLLRAADEQTDAVCGRINRGECKTAYSEEEGKKEYTDRHQLMDLVLSSPTDYLTCHGWLFRKALVSGKNIFFSEELQMGEDSEWVLRVLAECKAVSFISRPVYRYTVSNESTIHAWKSGKAEKYVKTLRMIEASGISKEKKWPVFVLMNLLLILTHDTFHANQPRSISVQLREARNLIESDLFKHALAEGDLSRVEMKTRWTLYSLRYHMMIPAWIAVKIRQAQNRHISGRTCDEESENALDEGTGTD